MTEPNQIVNESLGTQNVDTLGRLELVEFVKGMISVNDAEREKKFNAIDDMYYNELLSLAKKEGEDFANSFLKRFSTYEGLSLKADQNVLELQNKSLTFAKLPVATSALANTKKSGEVSELFKNLPDSKSLAKKLNIILGTTITEDTAREIKSDILKSRLGRTLEQALSGITLHATSGSTQDVINDIIKLQDKLASPKVTEKEANEITGQIYKLFQNKLQINIVEKIKNIDGFPSKIGQFFAYSINTSDKTGPSKDEVILLVRLAQFEKKLVQNENERDYLYDFLNNSANLTKENLRANIPTIKALAAISTPLPLNENLKKTHLELSKTITIDKKIDEISRTLNTLRELLPKNDFQKISGEKNNLLIDDLCNYSRIVEKNKFLSTMRTEFANVQAKLQSFDDTCRDMLKKNNVPDSTNLLKNGLKELNDLKGSLEKYVSLQNPDYSKAAKNLINKIQLASTIEKALTKWETDERQLGNKLTEVNTSFKANFKRTIFATLLNNFDLASTSAPKILSKKDLKILFDDTVKQHYDQQQPDKSVKNFILSQIDSITKPKGSQLSIMDKLQKFLKPSKQKVQNENLNKNPEKQPQASIESGEMEHNAPNMAKNLTEKQTNKETAQNRRNTDAA